MVKNKLDPDWPQGENNTFEFDMSKGELTDLKITLKDWNRLTSAKELGTAYIRVEQLERLMAGEPAPELGDEFLVSAKDGSPLIGKSKEQTFLVLKLKAKEGPPRAVADDDEVPVAEASQVGSSNLFNTPAKPEEMSEEEPRPPSVKKAGPSQDPTMPKTQATDVSVMKAGPSQDPTVLQKQPTGLSTSEERLMAGPEPAVEVMCDVETEWECTPRAPLKRMTIEERGDDLWRSVPRVSRYESVPPSPATNPAQDPTLYASGPQPLRSPPSVQAPKSLYATDSSRSGMDTLQGYCAGTYYVPTSRPRITLQDRGIDTTGPLYIREHDVGALYASAPSAPVRSEVGQDAFSSPQMRASVSPHRYEMDGDGFTRTYPSPQLRASVSPLLSMSRSPEKHIVRKVQSFRYPNGDSLTRAYANGDGLAQVHEELAPYAPSQPSDLAPGWEKKRDPASGREFYVNHDLKAKSWVRPTQPNSMPIAPSSGARRAGWRHYELDTGSSDSQPPRSALGSTDIESFAGAVPKSLGGSYTEFTSSQMYAGSRQYYLPETQPYSQQYQISKTLC